MKNYYQNNYTPTGHKKEIIAPLSKMVSKNSVNNLDGTIKTGVDTTSATALANTSSTYTLNKKLAAEYGDYSGDANRKYNDAMDKALDTNTTGGKLKEYGTYAAMMAPALYNLGQGLFGKVDKVNANDYVNPYEKDILARLDKEGKGQFNIEPQLYETRVRERSMDEAVRQGSNTHGEALNRMQANSIQRNKQVADLYAQKNNVENQWRNQATGQYANAAMQLGKDKANTKWMADQFNMQSKAAKQRLLSEGLSQSSEAVQQYYKMQNQIKNDRLKYAMLNEAYSRYGGDPEKMAPLFNMFANSGDADINTNYIRFKDK